MEVRLGNRSSKVAYFGIGIVLKCDLIEAIYQEHSINIVSMIISAIGNSAPLNISVYTENDPQR